jgi:hypothetical protein
MIQKDYIIIIIIIFFLERIQKDYINAGSRKLRLTTKQLSINLQNSTYARGEKKEFETRISNAKNTGTNTLNLP